MPRRSRYRSTPMDPIVSGTPGGTSSWQPYVQFRCRPDEVLPPHGTLETAVSLGDVQRDQHAAVWGPQQDSRRARLRSHPNHRQHTASNAVHPASDVLTTYSHRILSAHSISRTRTFGVANAAFFPRKSGSETPRAFAQALQTCIWIPPAMLVAKASASGGHPTGTIACAT